MNKALVVAGLRNNIIMKNNIQIIAYADDLMVLPRSIDALEEAVRNLKIKLKSTKKKLQNKIEKPKNNRDNIFVTSIYGKTPPHTLKTFLEK